MPVNTEVIALLQQRKSLGSNIIALSETDEHLLRELLPEADLFDSIKSVASANQDGIFLDQYDYLGTSDTNLETWRNATDRYVVEHSDHALSNDLKQNDLATAQSFHTSKADFHTLFKAVRPHQWLKNVLVFVPLIASQQLIDAQLLFKSLLMFLCFSLIASFGYIVNDILDIQSDRAHTEKRNRPFAKGDLSVIQGVVLAIGLLIAALLTSFLLSPTAAVVLIAYLALTLSYSAFLKTKLMLDVVTLGAAFTLRVVAGAAAIESDLSFYLLSFSIFLFASLGMVKRYAELLNLKKQDKLTAKGRGYQVDDMAPVRTIGIAMGTMSVFILGQYINSPLVIKYYEHPTLIWLLLPLLLYWLGRLWLLANRGEVNEDPLLFAVKDRASQLTLLLSITTLWLAN
ncbi:MAG: UbiA family prenyltransferase [Pseudomonadota bacterium]